MKAKGEQMERAIQSAGGAEPAPHAVPPKYATAEQMERLVDAIANGGGSGSGYTVEETRTVIIPEQTVTTEDDGDFISALLTVADGVTANFNVGDTLSFTINGETKSIDAEWSDGLPEDIVVFVFSGSVGEPQNPAILVVNQNSHMVMITTGLPEATYTISAELVTRTMTVSPEFQEARGYTSEERVTLVPEGTYTFLADGGDGAGWAYGLDFSSVPDMDFDSPPESVMIVVDGVEYEKQYNASESESSGYTAAIYGATDIPTNDCALMIELNLLRQGITKEAITPIVRLNVADGEEQHTLSAYFIRQPVTTTPDFDAAVAKTTEPLVLTLVPNSAQNPLIGTWTGATWQEVQDAATSGRDILATIPGFSYVKLTAAAYFGSELSWEIAGMYCYPMNGQIMFIQSILNSNNTYSSNVFQLTKVN